MFGLVCVLMLSAAPAGPVFAQEIKSLQLDLQDPAILDVRDVWRSVLDAADAGELKQEPVTDPCLEGVRWRDGTGLVRIYVYSGGTGDSFYTVRQYYDDERRLRFIHVTASAVTDASLESKVWIGEHGEVLRDDFKVEGGWAFMNFGDPATWTLDPDNLPTSSCGG